MSPDPNTEYPEVEKVETTLIIVTVVATILSYVFAAYDGILAICIYFIAPLGFFAIIGLIGVYYQAPDDYKTGLRPLVIGVVLVIGGFFLASGLPGFAGCFSSISIIGLMLIVIYFYRKSAK